VLVSIDWMEIRNDAYDRWRTVLAEAAGTDMNRVLVTCIHSHDAPTADLEAQRILEKHKFKARVCDLEFHEQAVQRTARALREAIKKASPVTHFGTGQTTVDKVASNRRYIGKDGKPRFDRGSSSKDLFAQAQPEGTIDPWLKTLSFWNGDTPLAAVTAYATHPQSYYRTGRVSCDFPGIARNRRQADDPKIAQIHVAGASGNVTAGKYYDATEKDLPAYRQLLADRVYQGMVASWKATRKQPLTKWEFRSAPLRFEPRDEPEKFTVKGLEKDLLVGDRFAPLAALGLSWRKRADAGHKLEIPVVDFGPAQLLLLPAESYVEFQLFAQKVRPDSFVVTMGYGECAPGYIPIEQAWDEGDENLGLWCWIARGAEQRMKAAIEKALKP
jgi:hypothetical protein